MPTCFHAPPENVDRPPLCRDPDGRHDEPDAALSALVRLRADSEVMAWARSIRDSLTRAAALLGIGESLLVRANIGETSVFSNGPDMCRDMF